LKDSIREDFDHQNATTKQNSKAYENKVGEKESTQLKEGNKNNQQSVFDYFKKVMSDSKKVKPFQQKILKKKIKDRNL